MVKQMIKWVSTPRHAWIVLVILMGTGSCPADGAGGTDAHRKSQAQESVYSLTQVIDMALAANRTILESDYAIQSQAYGVTSAESEFAWKYMPSTSATVARDVSRLGAGVALQKKTRLGPTLRIAPELVQQDTLGSEETLSGQIDVGLTIPLLRGWGRTVNLSALDSADYTLRSLQRSHYLGKVTVVLDTVAAVYAIIEQEHLERLSQQQIQRLSSHAVLAAAKERIGLATPMDLYRAQIRLKDAQDQLNRSQEALANAQDRLKIIVAVSLDDQFSVTAPLTFMALKIPMQQALSTAFEHRVELDQAVDEIEHLQKTVQVAQHNIKPQLDLVSRYNHLGVDESFATVLEPEEDFWSVSLVSTTDWGRTAERADYQRAMLAVKSARLNRWSLNDAIRRQIRQNYDAILKSEERMQIRREQIQQASEKLALAQVQFNHGMADNSDIIEAQSELQLAEINLLTAKIEHIVGRYQLRAAMGTLIEYKQDDARTDPK